MSTSFSLFKYPKRRTILAPTKTAFQLQSGNKLSTIMQKPDGFTCLFVMGHGSGSNMEVALMNGLADALYYRGIATLRFNYPYSESSDFVPFTDMPVDPEPVMIETIRSALNLGHDLAETRPVVVGGHSISGFLASRAVAHGLLKAQAVIALAFPRKGDPARSAHLNELGCPMLIVQGTKDTLGTYNETTEMVETLQGDVELRWVEQASHAFTADNALQSDLVAVAAGYISGFVGRL